MKLNTQSFALNPKHNTRAANVPVSLHIDYHLGDAEDGATKISLDKKEVFNAMKKDLQKVHEIWQLS